MFTHYRTQGFFLRKRDFGEADQLFMVYTKDFGALEVLGKAIRKVKSKLRQGADLFYLSEIEFIQGKNFKTLTDAILIDKFGNSRQNLNCLLASYKFAEIACSLINNQEKDYRVFDLVYSFFREFNKPGIKISLAVLIYYYFLWNLFMASGYGPELYKCFFCHKRISKGKNYFYPKGGSIICHKCFTTASNKKERIIPIEDDTIKLTRLFSQEKFNIVTRLKISPLTRKNLKVVSDEFSMVIC